MFFTHISNCHLLSLIWKVSSIWLVLDLTGPSYANHIANVEIQFQLYYWRTLVGILSDSFDIVFSKSPKLEYFKLGVSVGVLDLHQGGLGRQYLLCNICSYCWYYCTPASLHLHAHCVQCTVCTACSVCNLCTLNWQLTCLGTFVCVQAGFSTFSGWFWISKLDSMSVPLDLSLISLVCIFCCPK